MARARNIKPGLFKNEVLGVRDPILTLLFESLWCLADREGRLEDRPLRIKAETFPYREGLDVNGYLTELASLGFIRRYEVDGNRYIEVLKFKEHQTPHKTERDSVIPAPVEITEAKSDGCSTTVKAPLNDGEETAALPPDSSNTDSLIPDSLNTDSPQVGDKSPPPDKRAAKSQTLKAKDLLTTFPELSEQVAIDYLAFRKRKRCELTASAWTPISSEVSAAMQRFSMTADAVLCEAMAAGWQGFKLDWLAKRLDSQPAVANVVQMKPNSVRRTFGDVDYREGVSDDGSF